MSPWEWLSEAVSGPGHLRFVLQPLAAVVLGARDGRQDADEGRAPYLWGLLSERGSRARRLKQALRAVWMPLAIACTMDAILQYLTLRSVHLTWALFVGGCLVALPYVVARALSNRAVRSWRRHRAHGTPASRA